MGVASGGDRVGTEMPKSVAIVAEKPALSANPEKPVMVLVQGEDREIGQALLGPVHVEFPMLPPRR